MFQSYFNDSLDGDDLGVDNTFYSTTTTKEPHGISHHPCLPSSTPTEYCNKNNYKEYLDAVNAKLNLYGNRGGLPILSLLEDDDPSSSSSSSPSNEETGIAVINIVYDLLHKLDLERSKHQRTSDENERHLEEISELHERLEGVEGELEEARNNSAHANRVCETVRRELTGFKRDTKAEKEQLNRQITMLTSRETQFKHEANRKERQIETLKERVRANQVGKNRNEKQSMMLLSSLMEKEVDEMQKKGGAGMGGGRASKKALLKKDNEIAELRDENEGLRKCLFVTVWSMEAHSRIIRGVAEGKDVEGAFGDIERDEEVSEFLSVQQVEGGKRAGAGGKRGEGEELQGEMFKLPVQYLEVLVRGEVEGAEERLCDSLQRLLEENEKESADARMRREAEEEERLNEYDLNIELHKQDLVISTLKEENLTLKDLVERCRVRQGEVVKETDEQLQTMMVQVEEEKQRGASAKGELEELGGRIREQQEQQKVLVKQVEGMQKEREDLVERHKEETSSLLNQLEEHVRDRGTLVEKVKTLEEKIGEVQKERDDWVKEWEGKCEDEEDALTLLEEKQEQLLECVEEVKVIKAAFEEQQKQYQLQQQQLQQQQQQQKQRATATRGTTRPSTSSSSSSRTTTRSTRPSSSSSSTSSSSSSQVRRR